MTDPRDEATRLRLEAARSDDTTYGQWMAAQSVRESYPACVKATESYLAAVPGRDCDERKMLDEIARLRAELARRDELGRIADRAFGSAP